MPFNLLDIFFSNGRDQKVALVDLGVSISYTQLRHLVINAQQYLLSLELKAGQVVALIADDSRDSVALFLACLGLGVVPVMVNPSGADEVILDMLAKSNAECVFAGEAYYRKLVSVTDLSVSLIQAPVCVGHDLISIAVQEQAHAFYLFTSGTTGYPHCVCHRHRDVAIMCEDYGKDVLSLSENDILMATSKQFFAYGLNSILFALFFGATVVLAEPKIDAHRIWKHLATYQVSIFFAVPTVFNLILKDLGCVDATLSLRLAVSAGECLPVSIASKWQALTDVPIIDGIGTTEVLSTFVSNKPGDIKSGSTGRVVKGFEYEIRSEQGRLMSPGEIGLLWIKGKTYHLAYVDDPVASKRRFLGGWFNTMDLFSSDAEGYLTYHGRANDIIKCGGLWVYPYKMEQVLVSHPAIDEAAVKGIEQESGLLRPAAFVTTHEPLTDELMHDIKTYVKSHCQAGEYPHFIYEISQMPRTASGKVQRYRLNENSVSKESANAC